jgi:hypothetical protein
MRTSENQENDENLKKALNEPLIEKETNLEQVADNAEQEIAKVAAEAEQETLEQETPEQVASSGGRRRRTQRKRKHRKN